MFSLFVGELSRVLILVAICSLDSYPPQSLIIGVLALGLPLPPLYIQAFSLLAF